MHKPIVPWLGGKRRLAEHIIPKIPPHSTYVEPFCGGAAIFFLKEPSDCEVINDIDGELINLYRVVQNHLEEFVRHFKWALISREEFQRLSEARPDTLTDIQRASRFYYLQRTCFGARPTGRTFGVGKGEPPKFNLLRIEEDLSQAHLRFSRTYIENLPWIDCIKRYDSPDTVFYLDPPYWETAGYGSPFPFAEYEKILARALDVDGLMIISINDHPQMSELFSCLHVERVAINYTVAQSGATNAGELIITNKPVVGRQPSLL